MPSHPPPPSPRYFLGIDAGGSKTHALIADQAGNALGFGTAGPGNWQRVGFDGQQAVLQDVTRQALTMAGLPLEALSAAGFGMAGYDWPAQLGAHRETVAHLGIDCPLEIVNDSIIGLLAGASDGWGVVLVAGTGNNCRGRDRSGREGRITGEGTLFGESGGGGDVVDKAVQAVAYEWTRRGPRTAISGKFAELCGARDLDDLIEGIDLKRYHPDADWAPAVFEAAHAGDAVARQVIEWCGRELGESAAAVIRQLDLQEEEVEIIQIGSLFKGGPLYTRPLIRTIRRTAPRARFVRLDAPPVIGGVVLAMQQLGLDASPVRNKLIRSAQALLPRSASDT